MFNACISKIYNYPPPRDFLYKSVGYLSVIAISAMLSVSAYAGGSIFGHKAKTVNTNGVHSIGVHICSSLECPPVRIFKGKCDQDHMSMHWGVCVCDKGYVPRNGKCDACPEGQYSDGIYDCQSCPKGKYIAHDGDTECTKCPDGAYCINGQKYDCPAYAACSDTGFGCNEGFTTSPTSCVCSADKYIDGDVCKECPTYTECTADKCCTLTGPVDVCGNKTPELWGFKDTNGTCRSCSNNAGITANASECAKCDTTDTPRTMLGEFCFLKQNCQEDEFQSYNQCVSCSSKGVYSTSSEQCSKCKDALDNPTRQMFGNNCVLKECPNGMFQGDDGSCHDCSSDEGYYYFSNVDLCAQCDDTDTPREIFTYYGASFCGLKECPDGRFRDGFAGCHDCSSPSSYISNADLCAQCDNTATPRVMFDELFCTLEFCPDGWFRSWDGGACFDCSEVNNFSAIAEECSRCDGTDYPRYMDGDQCKRCTVENAAACYSDEAIACKEGYYVKDGACLQCPDHATCDGIIVTCDEGYTLEYGECFCAEHAIACDSDGKATTCEEGYTPQDGVCVEVPTSTPVDCSSDANACSGCQTCQDGVCKDDATQCSGGTCTNGSCTCSDGKEMCGTTCCSSTQLCGSANDHDGDYTCYNPNIACTKNSDCDSGEYCNITASNCKTFTSSTACTATSDSDLTPVTYNGKTFYAGPSMSWWAAENFCLAHGKKLASLGSLGLSTSYDYRDPTFDWDTGTGEKPGPLYTTFNTAGVANGSFWTSNNGYNSCYMFAVRVPSGFGEGVGDDERYNGLYALCE